jgi:hypothetical protein
VSQRLATKAFVGQNCSYRHHEAVKIRLKIAGKMISWLVRGIGSSLSYEVTDEAGVLTSTAPREPLIWVFWHNRMFVVPYLHQRWFPHITGCILSSPSGDGQIIADVCAEFGFQAARGSSSKPEKGMAALIKLAEMLKNGCDVGITPDGPRGPVYQLHPGPLKLAQLTGAQILPMQVDYESAWTFPTWDLFQLPKPLSKAHIKLHAPITIPRKLDEASFEQQRVDLETLLRPS